jgi:hypothetical protein
MRGRQEVDNSQSNHKEKNEPVQSRRLKKALSFNLGTVASKFVTRDAISVWISDSCADFS